MFRGPEDDDTDQEGGVFLTDYMYDYMDGSRDDCFETDSNEDDD